MANVGWWNRLGSLAFSIPRVKDDLEIWLNTFFITSVPTPLGEGLLRFLWWRCSSSQEKDSFWGVGFVLRSSRPLSVYGIFFIIGGDIRVGRGSFLLCSTDLLLQIINLLLHGFIITLLMGYVIFPSKITSTRVDGMRTAFLIVFPISFKFKIEELILFDEH